jgi:6-phosphogluconolactonase/glucosamine-6-phosphate isomerase/deaminase
MKFLRFSGDDGLVAAVNEWGADRAKKYAAKTLFLPTGGTPVPLYKAWEAQPPAFLKGLQLSQLDEVVSGPLVGVFEKFFADSLPTFSSQFLNFKDVKGPGDLVILGIGQNGHVAFHEPGYPRDWVRGVLTVADEDCDAMKMPHGTKADTFGTGSFIHSKAILLLARGASKKSLLHRMVNDAHADFPAAYLRDHPDFTILVDEAADPTNSGTVGN